MKFDLYSFRTCKYIGEDSEYFTKGKEYGIVYVGKCAWINNGRLLGIFLTSDEYTGDDIDYCVFCDWKGFNGDFVHGLEVDVWKRSERRYAKHVKITKKINLYRDKKDNESVDYYLETSNPTKLFKWKIKHDCDYCQRGRQHSSKKRETSLIEKLKEFNSTKGAE